MLHLRPYVTGMDMLRHIPYPPFPHTIFHGPDHCADTAGAGSTG